MTARGDVFVGPLFIMEKMPAGFSDTMIMPDSSLFGTTNADGHDRVEFCAHCHAAAGDRNDHLFFLPGNYRAASWRPATETDAPGRRSTALTPDS